MRSLITDQSEAVVPSEKLLNGGRMLNWALTFLVIALLAALFGFGGVAGTAAGIAKVLFFVFLALFLVSLLIPRFRPPA
jgi:uncharacterized membrane protein YtjA (UPF0391 family)